MKYTRSYVHNFGGVLPSFRLVVPI